jgi:hypothetical protein
MILRVAEGNAWQKHSILKSPLSMIMFSPDCGIHRAQDVRSVIP